MTELKLLQVVAIHCYPGITSFSTVLLNLIWSQYENFAFILVVYLEAQLIISIPNPGHTWQLNHALRDVHSMCAVTKVGTAQQVVTLKS